MTQVTFSLPRRRGHAVSLAIAVAFGCLIGGLALAWVPFREVLPAYLLQARELMAGAGVTNHYPVGYSLFLYLGLKLGGAELAGVYALQFLLFVATIAMAYLLLALKKCVPRGCLVGALVAALHPYLFLNLKQISDNTWSTFLLLATMAALEVARVESPIESGLLVGCVLGAALLFRANALFWLPLAYLLPRVVRSWPVAKSLLAFGAAAGLAVLGAGTVNRAVRGEWLLVHPYYSAYGLHNGNNPYSATDFLTLGKGEYSTNKHLRSLGIEPTRLSRDERTKVLRDLGIEFIAEHSLQYVKLVGIRIGIYLMPDFRSNPEPNFRQRLLVPVTKVVLALPVFLWAFLTWKRWRATGAFDRSVPIAFVLYSLPFVLLYADPRYRYPVDVLLLLDCVAMLASSGRGLALAPTPAVASAA